MGEHLVAAAASTAATKTTSRWDTLFETALAEATPALPRDLQLLVAGYSHLRPGTLADRRVKPFVRRRCTVVRLRFDEACGFAYLLRDETIDSENFSHAMCGCCAGVHLRPVIDRDALCTHDLVVEGAPASARDLVAWKAAAAEYIVARAACKPCPTQRMPPHSFMDVLLVSLPDYAQTWTKPGSIDALNFVFLFRSELALALNAAVTPQLPLAQRAAYKRETTRVGAALRTLQLFIASCSDTALDRVLREMLPYATEFACAKLVIWASKGVLPATWVNGHTRFDFCSVFAFETRRVRVLST